MQDLPWRQLRGAKDLAQDAVAATVHAVAEAHQDIARVPYVVLAHIPVVAEPSKSIEQVQGWITAHVYNTILAVNQKAGAAVDRVLDCLEQRDGSGGKS